MKYVGLLFASIFSCVFGESLKLNLDETIRRSLKESEDVKIQKNEVIKADNKTKETRSILFPQVTGELTYIDNLHFPNIPTTRFLKDFTFDAGINVNQIITTFGKISASIDAMKKLTSMNVYKEASVKDEVIFNSKLLYYNAYFAKRTLQIIKESYTNTLKSKEILENSSKMGRVSKKDIIKVEADIAARIPMISNAESSYATALESLKTSIGADPSIDIELLEGYPLDYKSFDSKESLVSLEQKNPGLKALRQAIEAQKDLVKSKKLEYFPTLSLFYRHNYKGSSDDFFIGNNTLFNYSAVGLNLQIPLFYGKRTSAKIRQSIAEKDNAILAFKKAKKNMELELEKSLTEYKELIQTIPANQKAIDLAEESFKQSLSLFAAGQLSVTDLNDAEIMLTNQKIKKETSLFKLQVNLAKINRLTCLGNSP